MVDYLIYYLFTVNIVGLITMGIDKSASKRKGGRRIPEKTLLLIALLGGSIGTILGMILFKHKTSKSLFKAGLPAILTLQLITVYLL